MKYVYKHCLGRLPVCYTSFQPAINSYVVKWTQFSEICAQFGHRSAVLYNERLVETFTRPSAAATYSIILWKTMFRPPKQSSTTDEERGILHSLVIGFTVIVI